jgi:hypothetical protein
VNSPAKGGSFTCLCERGKDGPHFPLVSSNDTLVRGAVLYSTSQQLPLLTHHPEHAPSSPKRDHEVRPGQAGLHACVV